MKKDHEPQRPTPEELKKIQHHLQNGEFPISSPAKKEPGVMEAVTLPKSLVGLIGNVEKAMRRIPDVVEEVTLKTDQESADLTGVNNDSYTLDLFFSLGAFVVACNVTEKALRSYDQEKEAARKKGNAHLLSLIMKKEKDLKSYRQLLPLWLRHQGTRRALYISTKDDPFFAQASPTVGETIYVREFFDDLINKVNRRTQKTLNNQEFIYLAHLLPLALWNEFVQVTEVDQETLPDVPIFFMQFESAYLLNAFLGTGRITKKATIDQRLKNLYPQEASQADPYILTFTSFYDILLTALSKQEHECHQAALQFVLQLQKLLPEINSVQQDFMRFLFMALVFRADYEGLDVVRYTYELYELSFSMDPEQNHQERNWLALFAHNLERFVSEELQHIVFRTREWRSLFTPEVLDLSRLPAVSENNNFLSKMAFLTRVYGNNCQMSIRRDEVAELLPEVFASDLLDPSMEIRVHFKEQLVQFAVFFFPSSEMKSQNVRKKATWIIGSLNGGEAYIDCVDLLGVTEELLEVGVRVGNYCLDQLYQRAQDKMKKNGKEEVLPPSSLKKKRKHQKREQPRNNAEERSGSRSESLRIYTAPTLTITEEFREELRKRYPNDPNFRRSIYEKIEKYNEGILSGAGVLSRGKMVRNAGTRNGDRLWEINLDTFRIVAKIDKKNQHEAVVIAAEPHGPAQGLFVRKRGKR